ncbi:hypothetical protein LENED_001954 [Lentinula edodes]|uniref:Uncharacterized protein n=1 Tax=Lentinula edodes TaxID=5353 RepID=A0A1Q3DZJ2_LENED|nr:hypothetical protein LENED_001954 [Lentinula edodes]
MSRTGLRAMSSGQNPSWHPIRASFSSKKCLFRWNTGGVNAMSGTMGRSARELRKRFDAFVPSRTAYTNYGKFTGSYRATFRSSDGRRLGARPTSNRLERTVVVVEVDMSVTAEEATDWRTLECRSKSLMDASPTEALVDSAADIREGDEGDAVELVTDQRICGKYEYGEEI